MNLGGGISGRSQQLRHLVRAAFGTGEQKHRARVLFEEFTEESPFHLFLHHEYLMGYPLCRGAGRGNLRAHRQAHVVGCYLHYFRRHGRREEHSLTVFRDDFQYPFYLRGKTHVEHAVGLVKDEDIRVVKTHAAPVNVVYEASRCRDDYAGVLPQGRELRHHGFAADKRRYPHAKSLRKRHEGVPDLKGKLAGGYQHQPAALLLGKALDHGNAERKGLASACLGDTHNVLALNRDGDGFTLDGSWNAKTQFFDLLEQGGRYAEPVETIIVH